MGHVLAEVQDRKRTLVRQEGWIKHRLGVEAVRGGEKPEGAVPRPGLPAVPCA